MKRHIFLIGLFGALLCATSVMGQEQTEMTAAEKNAVKVAEKEAKRAAKEEAKAEKELKKAENADAKAERKKEKRDKSQEKFDAYIENWEPISVPSTFSSAIPNTVDFINQSNLLFASLKEVYGYIDYIQIETLPENEEGIVEMKITNKNTGEAIAKTDALETYAKATLDLTAAAASATSLVTNTPTAISELTGSPVAGVAGILLAKKVKNAASAVKYSVDAIPLIMAKIQDNIAAVKQSKNN
jgi:hypothetical protein